MSSIHVSHFAMDCFAFSGVPMASSWDSELLRYKRTKSVIGSLLDQRHDVSLGILEPRRLRAAALGDALHRLHAGQVVVFELHAARLELLHLALEVVHLPKRLALLRGAGERRLVHEATRVVRELVCDAAGGFLAVLQADLLLVEAARALQVLGGNIRIHRKILQHGSLLSGGSMDGRAGGDDFDNSGSTIVAPAALRPGNNKGGT